MARSFRDLVLGMFRALGQPDNIDYIDMPPAIRDQYQYFTQAEIENLRRAGYNAVFLTCAAGVFLAFCLTIALASRHQTPVNP